MGVEVAGEEIALYWVDDAVYATHDVCTHAFARLSEGFLEGECIECRRPPTDAGSTATKCWSTSANDHTNSSRAAIFGSERGQVRRGAKFMAAGFARPKMADHILVHMLRHRRGNHQVMAFRAE